MPPFGNKPTQTISPERYLEIDAAMTDIPEGTSRLTHILNMSKLFGNDLSIYQELKDLKERGIVDNNSILDLPVETKKLGDLPNVRTFESSKRKLSGKDYASGEKDEEGEE